LIYRNTPEPFGWEHDLVPASEKAELKSRAVYRVAAVQLHAPPRLHDLLRSDLRGWLISAYRFAPALPTVLPSRVDFLWVSPGPCGAFFHPFIVCWKITSLNFNQTELIRLNAKAPNRR
jgi:hypothetical protein